MTAFDSLVEDFSDRFHLGNKTEPLIRYTLQLITGGTGGIGGFVDRLKSAGLGSEVNSWLGNSNPLAMTSQQVESALGHNAVNGMASKLGLGFGAVSGAIGYLLPKLIGLLTPGGKVPSEIPAYVSNYLASGPKVRFAQEQVAPLSMRILKDQPGRSAWLIPLAVALGAAALIWGFLGHRPTGVVTREAPVIGRTAAIPTPPAPVPAVPAAPVPSTNVPGDLFGDLNRTVINFRSGSAQLTAASKDWLLKAAALIKELPAGTVVEIDGHTDSVGNSAANIQLSQHRADAVRHALVKDGVSPDSLKAVGLGSSKPVASNDSARGRSENRRTEFTTG